MSLSNVNLFLAEKLFWYLNEHTVDLTKRTSNIFTDTYKFEALSNGFPFYAFAIINTPYLKCVYMCPKMRHSDLISSCSQKLIHKNV